MDCARKKDFIVKVDGDNIIVDDYSMPVKKENGSFYAFVFSAKKTSIKASGNAAELYDFIVKEKDGVFSCYIWNLVNWIINFGKASK